MYKRQVSIDFKGSQRFEILEVSVDSRVFKGSKDFKVFVYFEGFKDFEGEVYSSTGRHAGPNRNRSASTTFEEIEGETRAEVWLLTLGKGF